MLVRRLSTTCKGTTRCSRCDQSQPKWNQMIARIRRSIIPRIDPAIIIVIQYWDRLFHECFLHAVNLWPWCDSALKLGLRLLSMIEQFPRLMIWQSSSDSIIPTHTPWTMILVDYMSEMIQPFWISLRDIRPNQEFEFYHLLLNILPVILLLVKYDINSHPFAIWYYPDGNADDYNARYRYCIYKAWIIIAEYAGKSP